MGKVKSLLAAGIVVTALLSGGGVASASAASSHHQAPAAAQPAASQQAPAAAGHARAPVQKIASGPYLWSWYLTWLQCDVTGTWEAGQNYWAYWYCAASIWPPYGYDLYYGWFD